jgi:hypothetical protein
MWEVKKMKRKLFLEVFLALFLAVSVLASGIAPAFSSTTNHEYISTRGLIVINIPDHPEIELICQHFDPNSDHGAANTLFLFMLTKSGTFAPTAVLSTTQERVTFQQQLFAGYPMGNNAILVDKCDLQICRIGKTVLAYWTVPIKGTITGNVPHTNIPWSTAIGASSFEIPPGGMILNGYGSATTSTTTAPLASGYTIVSNFNKLYDAHATFICPSWHYFGPASDTLTPSVCTNTELIITGP